MLNRTFSLKDFSRTFRPATQKLTFQIKGRTTSRKSKKSTPSLKPKNEGWRDKTSQVLKCAFFRSITGMTPSRLRKLVSFRAEKEIKPFPSQPSFPKPLCLLPRWWSPCHSAQSSTVTAREAGGAAAAEPRGEGLTHAPSRGHQPQPPGEGLSTG